MFYNYNKILSYNAMINILIGERGVGKTYGATKFVVNQYIKKGEQFAYIRRYRPELKKACPNFFDSLKSNSEFIGHNLYSKGSRFYDNDEVIGYAMTLATAQDLKSANFSKVKTIIFDEFIIETGQKKAYLKNEVFTFLNLLETIGRLRDIRVLMLANSASITNPYFMFFDLKLPYNSDIKLFKDGMILLQYMKNEEYRDFKKSTRFGKLIAGTEFEEYSVNNKFIDDNKDFIEKKSASAKFSFGFIYNSSQYGVWNDFKGGLVYVSKDLPPDPMFMFSMTLEDSRPNVMMLKTAKKYNCFKMFMQNLDLGVVRFENVKIKNVVYEMLKKMII